MDLNFSWFGSLSLLILLVYITERYIALSRNFLIQNKCELDAWSF